MPSCTLCESPACTFSKIQHFSAVAQEKASQTKTRKTANSKAKFSENFPLWEVFLFCGSLPGLGDLNVCQRMKKPSCDVVTGRNPHARGRVSTILSAALQPNESRWRAGGRSALSPATHNHSLPLSSRAAVSSLRLI